MNRWRRIRRSARRPAAIRPSHDRVNLRLVQGTVVVKMPVFWIGQPRRHFSRGDRALDSFGPGTSTLIIEEGKRPNLTRPVAGLAMLLNEWQHVLVERRSPVAYRSLVNLSTCARRFCRPNSSPQRQPDGRQSNEALCRHLPPPITLSSMMHLITNKRVLPGISVLTCQIGTLIHPSPFLLNLIVFRRTSHARFRYLATNDFPLDETSSERPGASKTLAFFEITGQPSRRWTSLPFRPLPSVWSIASAGGNPAKRKKPASNRSSKILVPGIMNFRSRP